MSVRLGNLIENSEEKSYDRRVDNLASRVFDPAINQETVKLFYVQSEPVISVEDNLEKQFASPLGKIGKFELEFLSKVLNPPRPIVCVVGPLGCGKTTLKNYLIETLVTKKYKCDPHGPIIAQINFNDHLSFNDLDEDELSNKVYQEVCKELTARLYFYPKLDEREEFTDFWELEFARFNEAPRKSKAFREIISKLQQKNIKLYFNTSDEVTYQRQLELQKQIREEIRGNAELNLDYLVWLWNYLLHAHFSGKHGCIFIVFDNLDAVNARVQHCVVELLKSSLWTSGVTFYLLVRPETFDYNSLGTGVIDVIHHHGPSVAHVIKDRLFRFVNNPEAYYSVEDGLSRSEFDTIVAFVQKINQYIYEESHHSLESFLGAAAGSSHRVALLIAQNLLRVSFKDMVDSSTNINDVIRTCVTNGCDQMRWTRGDVTENIFRVTNASSQDLLVKLRILAYLSTHRDKRRRISEVCEIMGLFGHDRTVVVDAINDMMEVKSQLIRSNGFDSYDMKEFDFSHKIVISDIGEGYLKNLIENIHFVQETALDTFVSERYFAKRVRYQNLSDKFEVLLGFLKELRRIDRKEMEMFIYSLGAEAYRDENTFDGRVLSFEIITSMYKSAKRILRATNQRVPRYEVITNNLLDEFASLATLAANDYEAMLGTRAPLEIEE